MVLFFQEYIGFGDFLDKKMLIIKQVDWVKSSNEFKVVVEMYILVGEFCKVIDIIGEYGWADM